MARPPRKTPPACSAASNRKPCPVSRRRDRSRMIPPSPVPQPHLPSRPASKRLRPVQRTLHLWRESSDSPALVYSSGPLTFLVKRCALTQTGASMAAKKKKSQEPLVVSSKVKAALKDMGCNTAGDALDGLN